MTSVNKFYLLHHLQPQRIWHFYRHSFVRYSFKLVRDFLTRQYIYVYQREEERKNRREVYICTSTSISMEISSRCCFILFVLLLCIACARAREREREKEEFMHLSSNITTTTTPPVIGKASDHETTLSRARHAEKINERKLSTMIDQNWLEISDLIE